MPTRRASSPACPGCGFSAARLAISGCFPIADRLFQLRHARVLHQPWQVRTELDNESGGDAAFSLEPALRPGDAPTLGGLRHDALVLADGFADAVRAAARAQTKAP